MENNHQYADRAYWDQRFLKEEKFEWLADFHAFKHLILPHLTPHSRFAADHYRDEMMVLCTSFDCLKQWAMLSSDKEIILHIGCGSSQMSMQLYNMGYKNITNVDYSKVLVDAGRDSHPYMEWICDDIRFLANIPSGSFDVVLEKATLEAFLVTEKSPWSPSDSALETIDNVLKSVARVLTNEGIFISISFTQPHFRVPALLRLPQWSVSVEEFGEFFHYFVYVMHCGKETSKEVKERYGTIAPDWTRTLTVID